MEVEAYDQSEPASHTFVGPTERNRVMFGPAGHLYVYRSYGIHWCCNVVTGEPHHGAAVLLRALMPTVGLEHLRRRRGELPDRDLARGPGRLCQAIGIDRSHNGWDLTRSELRIFTPPRFQPPPAKATPRIGISKATELPWRFCIAGNPYVSGKASLR